MLKYVRTPSFCILATRVGISVLEYFGIRARPLSVSIQVANAEYVRLANAGLFDKMTREELEQSGAWCIYVGPDSPGPEWPGHLLIGIDRGAIDLNFGQFYRPAKHINVPSVAAFVGYDNTRECGYNAYGCVITIRPLGDNRYLQAPDWRNQHPDIIGEIIRAMKGQL
jgi:hypothetical protein